MNREIRRDVIVAPLLLWGGLIGLVALNAGYAFIPGLPIKPVVNLAIGIGMALLIAIFFMQLRRSAALVRLAAMAGVIWASYLFLLVFADLLTRP